MKTLALFKKSSPTHHSAVDRRLEQLSVSNQVSVAILLGVGCESHDAVHALYKRRFSQAWPCPVTPHSVSLLLRKSIKPTIDLTLQIPHD